MYKLYFVYYNDSCFHNRANCGKTSKTVRELNVREDVTTDFYSNITSKPIKSVLPRKSVHKSMSSKRLSRASVSSSSVESNVSFSVSGKQCLFRSKFTSL